MSVEKKAEATKKTVKHVAGQSKGGRLKAFNWPLVGKTVLLIAAIAPSAYGWHHFRLNRSADAFREQAEGYERDEKWAKAADYWLRFTWLQPKDGEARIRLAVAFGRSLEGVERMPAAADFYSVAIGVDPTRLDLHRDLANVLYRSASVAQAADRAREGLRLEPKDPSCLKTLALSLHSQSRLVDKIPMNEVTKAFADALEQNPRDIELSTVAARFYREDERDLPEAKSNALADDVMNRLVRQDPNDAALLLARFEYRTKYRLPGADGDLDRALETAPKNPSALYYFGCREMDRRAYIAAETYFRKAIDSDGRDHRGYLGLAKSLNAQGNRKDAADTLRRGIQFVGGADLALRSDWATLLTSLNRLEEAKELINSLERTSAFAAPLLNSAERIELQNGIRLLRCQWMMTGGDHLGTIKHLRGLLTTPVGARSSGVLQHTQGYLMLGACHAALHQWDLAAGAYEQAARLQPLSAAIRVQQAESLEQAGQLDQAIRTYETALRMTDVPNTAATSLARCRLRYQLSKPEADRNWTQFETDLVVAQQAQTDALGVLFLQAGYARAQGRKDDALAIMRKAELELAEVTDAWFSIAIVYDNWGLAQDADRAWLRYRQLKGQSAEEVALRCELLSRRRDFDAARAYVQERIPLLSGEEQRRARTTAAFLELRAGQIEQGSAMLEKLVAEAPDDVRTLEALGEVYLERGNLDQVAKIERALNAAEGDDGCVWREFECRRIFAQPGRTTAAQVTRVARLQTEMESLRPNWPRGFLVKGILYELQSNPAAAVAAYEQALKLGDQRPEVYRQLIPLLFASNRLSDANRYLAMLGPDAVVDVRTTMLSINAHLRGGETDRAVDLARAMAERDPKNPMARIWLGQTLHMVGRKSDAEKALREAITQFPEDPRSWMGMFGYQLREGDKAAAETTLKELGKHERLKPEQRAFLQAQGYEMLGNDVEANRLYREARQMAPNDVVIQQTCGVYLMRRSPDDAEKSLRRVLDLAPSSGAARRALASILAARGGEKAWQEAWKLLEHDKNSEDVSAADERLRALLLVHRGAPENRRAALQIMERLTLSVTTPTDGDRLLLAKLYDDAGRSKEASAQLLLLTKDENCDVSHLAVFADFLLRQGRFKDAEPVLKRLEARAKESFVTHGLRARWFIGMNRATEVAPLIDGFTSRSLGQTENALEQSQILLEAATLFSNLKMPQDAERYYRRLLERAPREYRFLARFLVLNDRTSEAVTVCIQASEKQDLVSAASLLCSVLSRGQAAKEDHERAEPVIAKALEAHNGDVSFLFSLATLRYFQQRKEEALKLYLKVLETFPEHVAVLNNVSNLLSEIPTRRGEALEYITRAIAVQGPHSDLLDTMGVVHLRLGNPQEAVTVLERACASPSPDARYLFHLALAQMKSGHVDDARKAMMQAEKLDLGDTALTAEERLSLESLQRQLAEK